MTGTRGSGRAAVHWLTAQAVLFGIMAALLGIVANAMFLDAYGIAWLPVTYIFIGVAGIVVSGAIARTAQTFDLLGIALAVLTTAAVAIGAAWLVAVGGDGAWVSAPLLVLFPILIQLGFVFIGGQAGRILDIAGIKASFPRIMTGFPVGAVIGGLLGAQLVAWLGRTEDLLLATAIAQAGFAGLVWATAHRYPAELGSDKRGQGSDVQGRPDDEGRSSPSVWRLLRSRFVVLVIAYQVLSALGSQLADFLVFDRATAQYPDRADLARFLGGYTAVMNAVSIAFLFIVAGPLLRRFGLRLGVASNPIVLTVFAVGMGVVLAVSGATSLALLATVSAARIADIVLTDGTTRTSINAIYQVIPDRARLSVQTAVEGVGVPVAIGISGVLIIVLNALPFTLAATIGVTVIVCGVWTWVSRVLYRAYGPALGHALRRRPLLVPTARLDATPEDESVARRLLSSRDPRATRLGVDLLTAMSTPALAAEFAALTDDPRADVRISALAGLAASGDGHARRRLAGEVRTSVASTDPAIRLRAAQALEALDSVDRAAAGALLEDDDVAVRCAALESVQAGDLFALGPAIAGLEDVRVLGAAAGAVDRLGDAVVPLMAELLDTAASPAPSLVVRLVRAVTTGTPGRDEVLRRHVGHRDRDLGLVVMERLVAPEPAADATATALDDVLLDDVRHAARMLAAMAAMAAIGDDLREADRPVRRALGEEFDLIRSRVMAGRLARHGSERLGPAMVELRAGASSDALAMEALGVQLSRAESNRVLPLLQPDVPIEQRQGLLAAWASDAPTDLAGWLRDLVEDADDRWRSNWLRACAIHAANARGVLDEMDVRAARALGDPIIDEALGRRASRIDDEVGHRRR